MFGRDPLEQSLVLSDKQHGSTADRGKRLACLRGEFTRLATPCRITRPAHCNAAAHGLALNPPVHRYHGDVLDLTEALYQRHHVIDVLVPQADAGSSSSCCGDGARPTATCSRLVAMRQALLRPQRRNRNSISRGRNHILVQ